jgi:hypothetical protein
VGAPAPPLPKSPHAVKNRSFVHVDEQGTLSPALTEQFLPARAALLKDYLQKQKTVEKWRSPLFGATCNFNDKILPYGILFLTFINTKVFYLLSFKFSR